MIEERPLCPGCGGPTAAPKSRASVYLAGDRIVCSPCVLSGSTKPLHAKLWPDCPKRWHDFWDHGTHAKWKRRKRRVAQGKPEESFALQILVRMGA